MKKLLISSLLLISSVSHAALLEESDLVGRIMIVNQDRGDFLAQLDISNDTSNTKIGTLKIKMSVASANKRINALCSGSLDLRSQELNIYQCNDSATTAILDFTEIETLPYLLGGLASAKFSIKSTKINSNDELVDVKNLDKR